MANRQDRARKPRIPRPAPMAPDPYDVAELGARLHFAPDEGKIWLDDQRMILMHMSALGVLRRELIERLGRDEARGLLTRVGYSSGTLDSAVANQLRERRGPIQAMNIGPKLHMLEGIASVTTVRTEIDQERGHFYGEYVWEDSSEAEEHIRIYGIGNEPVCWTQIGYASGFTSRFMGLPILFREVECRGQGAPHCRIVGKAVDDWGDAEADLRFLRADELTGGLSVPQGDAGGSAAAILGSEDVVGVSAGFNAVCHKVRRVADTRATVLFLGESGVGKEILAHALHRISPRADGPFIAVNCAAIPETLVEAELFGVEKGAFTGAAVSRPGRFERASGGTLFLDEIGILSLTSQGKLLRALQEREVERVGGSRTIPVDVRVIAATNLDLRNEVREGRFREDLYFRLNVFPIIVPPLRERLEDIPVFMNHFLRKFCLLHNRSAQGFTVAAINAMLTYPWPGNIRELENVVERGVIMAPDGGAIDLFHLFVDGESFEPQPALPEAAHRHGGEFGLPQLKASHQGAIKSPTTIEAKVHQVLAGVAGSDDTPSLAEIEDALITAAIRQANGNLAAAARLLGMTRAQLVYRQKVKREK
jgi:two-component system, NtrC family, response regulator HydG